MQRPIVIVTGAAGFLGSALTVDLSRDHSIVAIDRREPGEVLLDAAPGVEWHQVDVAEREALADVFRNTRRRYGRIDLLVHLAAFYHFDLDWHPEYERTNVGGTANVVQSAIDSEVAMLLFASSLVAMRPLPPGTMLDGRTPTAEIIPYGKSKAMGEAMIARASEQLPSIVLRIGGVFSDWCELPPLCSLIKLWGARTPFGNIVVGRGESGIPYVHRVDWVRLVRSCIERERDLGVHEVFLASQHGAVSHEDLFLALKRARPGALGAKKPIHVSPALARIALRMKTAFGRVTGKMPYERPWMLDYVDRPWVADTTYTRNRLGWDCSESLQIRERIPVLLSHFHNDRPLWERRNRERATRRYSYSPD
jgi:nucleoside-diphosphate-sugar epimerase